MPYGKKRSPRGRKPYVKRARKYAKKVSAAVKTYVKRTISAKLENKQHISYASSLNVTTVNGVTGSAGNFLSLIPPLTQGVNEAHRIGNEVSPKSGVIRGTISLKPSVTGSLTQPVYLKMWLVSYKMKSYPNALLANCLDFFNYGGSTSSSFQGTLLDLHADVNQEVWKVHATKTVLMGTPSFVFSSSTAGYTANANPCFNFSFNWGKYIKKKLLFDDSLNGNTCTNSQIYLISQPVSADGLSSNITPCAITYVSKFIYEDA